MDGYAAYGRVDRRRVVAGPERGVVTREPASPPVLGVIVANDRTAEASRLGRRLHDGLAAAREQWAIATFYLFDANSWR